MSIEPGLSAERFITVQDVDTAAQWGSGLVPVYATPSLVGLMESTAVEALKGHLQAGTTTVGARIDVRHLAATPVGMQVRAHAELVEVEGKKLTFKIQAFDAVEQVGEANHVRFIVDEEKFIARAKTKNAGKSEKFA